MSENKPAASGRKNITPETRRAPQLPFTKKKKDFGSTVYDHRAGLCSMLIVYLVVAIIFVGSKVVIDAPREASTMVLDIRTLEELQKIKENLENEVRMRQQEQRQNRGGDDGGYARNVVSNEGADLRDDRNTDMSGLRARAGAVGGRLGSNRDAWEQGMREIEAMKNSKGGGDGANANNDARVKGSVLVSFSLLNPTRYSADLITPGYLCERGGEVVVSITVNRNGNVVSAVVDRSLSDEDNCMHTAALDAARRSRFNVDSSAPERQSGTITYVFMRQ